MRVQKRLFETTIPDDLLDEEYTHVRDDESCAEDREYLESLWPFFAPLADRDFHSALQRQGQFQSRMWEMRLAWTVHRLGHRIEPSRGAGPDLTLATNPRTHVEAVAPRPTDKLLDNYRDAHERPVPFPETHLILRATASIREKRVKYAKYLADGLVHLRAVRRRNLWRQSSPG